MTEKYLLEMTVVPFTVQIHLQMIKHIYFFAEQHIHNRWHIKLY
jgi:hypothetical protein